MSNLSVSVFSSNESVQTHLNWLIDFMTVGQVSGVEGSVLFTDEPDRASVDRTTAVIWLSQDESDEQPPSAVAKLAWPPTRDSFEQAVYQALTFLKEAHTPNVVHPGFRELIGISEGIIEARALMAKVADSDATVLVTGESGTGKEVVARSLHGNSRRAARPFVPVNCGAIPAELLESELFGHEKGAFTGAVTAKAGRFELAEGGTLFLDEIGDMPLTMQVKVLRALQDKAFERVGGIETRQANVRVIAATHRDLASMISAGTFREDLFYRLNVFPIELLPLRQRTEDLPLLVAEISEKIAREQGLNVRLTVDTLAVLAAYPWPGNVRELRNLLERLSIQYPNEMVSTRDLPAKYVGRGTAATPVAGATSTAQGTASDIDRFAEPESVARLPVNGLDLKDYLSRLECSLIEQALEDTNSVVARAADRLHIRRTTLVEKMRKYGIGRAIS